MTDNATVDLHPCECGCGELVRNRFKRGHSRRKGPDGRRLDDMPPRARGPRPLPAPDVDDDELDDIIGGHVQPAPEPEPLKTETWDRVGDSSTFKNRDTDETVDLDELVPDPEPAHIKPPRGRGRATSDRAPAARKTRVTDSLRKDISAKIGFVLEPAGHMWAARDPFCGGRFVEQTPAIRSSLTDIVCDSPDLIAWFTGPAGGFMKYLNLAAALAPVGVAYYGHHMTKEAHEAHAQLRQMQQAGTAPPNAVWMPGVPAGAANGQAADYSRYAA